MYLHIHTPLHLCYPASTHPTCVNHCWLIWFPFCEAVGKGLYNDLCCWLCCTCWYMLFLAVWPSFGRTRARYKFQHYNITVWSWVGVHSRGHLYVHGWSNQCWFPDAFGRSGGDRGVGTAGWGPICRSHAVRQDTVHAMVVVTRAESLKRRELTAVLPTVVSVNEADELIGVFMGKIWQVTDLLHAAGWPS